MQLQFLYHFLDCAFRTQAKLDFVVEEAWFQEGSIACFQLSKQSVLSQNVTAPYFFFISDNLL
jgi:hypothetical protein